MAEKKSAIKPTVKFAKDVIVGIKKYRDKVDVVNAVLEDGKSYTLEEVDNKVKEFMKGKVK